MRDYPRTGLKVRRICDALLKVPSWITLLEILLVFFITYDIPVCRKRQQVRLAEPHPAAKNGLHK